MPLKERDFGDSLKHHKLRNEREMKQLCQFQRKSNMRFSELTFAALHCLFAEHAKTLNRYVGYWNFNFIQEQQVS